jgi:predicted RNA binding protein YcfA (HicA-like mRNA interferase family)
MPRFFSGKAISHILSNKYGFKEVRIVGSHLKMRKTLLGKVITVIIPLHKEVSTGTFHSILRQARINMKDFIEKSRE